MGVLPYYTFVRLFIGRAFCDGTRRYGVPGNENEASAIEGEGMELGRGEKDLRRRRELSRIVEGWKIWND